MDWVFCICTYLDTNLAEGVGMTTQSIEGRRCCIVSAPGIRSWKGQTGDGIFYLTVRGFSSRCSCSEHLTCRDCGEFERVYLRVVMEIPCGNGRWIFFAFASLDEDLLSNLPLPEEESWLEAEIPDGVQLVRVGYKFIGACLSWIASMPEELQVILLKLMRED